MITEDSLPNHEKDEIIKIITIAVHSIDKDVLNALFYEEERIAIIIAVAYIESMTEKILDKRFVKDRNTQLGLFKQGFIETLSSKLKIAHLLGVYNKNTYRILSRLRELRNDCAHQITLDFSKGKAHGDKLESIYDEMRLTPMCQPLIKMFEDGSLFIIGANGERITTLTPKTKLIVPLASILITLHLILDRTNPVDISAVSDLIIE